MKPHLPSRSGILALALMGFSYATPTSAQAPAPAPAANCPQFGWSEGLTKYQAANAPFPTGDTPVGAPDCAFHQWSWEAFVWATAFGSNGLPRFLTLPTPADLLGRGPNTGTASALPLTLAARSTVPHGTPGFTEGAGAFVEADGNILIAPNGFPVYASVHMNPSYFATAKKNLIATNGYVTQPATSYFDVGAAVFKATWLRLADGQPPPAGAYTTRARVPVLNAVTTNNSIVVAPIPGQFVQVTVALVGLHVVGYTINHPEFLWSTFEHKRNAPAVPDNSFSASGSDPNNYTFYRANTPFANVNQAPTLNQPPTPQTITFDPRTQTFSPRNNNVVLENRTGGENQPSGPGNVFAVNAQGQSFLIGQKKPQSVMANYNLNGTLWMAPNSYNLNSGPQDGVGSVNLANSTAETYEQFPRNTPMSTVQNCFSCHNATSYSFQNPPPAKLPNRLIAISHVLGVGTPYAVPNMLTGAAPGQPSRTRK